jgi:hypothetical protein
MGALTFVILAALAAFRLAELFVVDNGPYDILVHLRGYLFQEGVPLPQVSRIRRKIGGVFQCVHCLGLWLAIPLTLIYYIHNFYLDAVIVYLAICGLQSIFAHNLGRVG